MRIALVTLAAAAIGLSCCQQLSRAAAPAFTGTVEPVRWADLRFSYRAGCPVGPPDLRAVAVSHWGFDGKPHVGRIVVARRLAPGLVPVFRKLWQARFPIRRLQPVSAFRGSDDASMAADNTSGFNCRFVGGTSRWSMHAYGEAIDVNPVENPYVRGSTVSPPAGRAYLDRSRSRPGMAVRGGVLVRAFAAAGWKWGASFGDYQHFSTTGR
ncbi:MAG TPA: M15 family metallopeptidase [Gaiellaceae bacterium]|nr:M15 family metallopeptidase [Gaiellaceae bacterium]